MDDQTTIKVVSAVLDLQAVVQQVPKSELHVHLRGAVPVELFARLLNEIGVENALAATSEKRQVWLAGYENIQPFLAPRSWSVEEVGSLFQYRTFEQFLATWVFVQQFFRCPEELRQLVHDVVARLRAQNIVYAEITVSALEYVQMGIPLRDVLASLEEAKRVDGIRVQWIVDLIRDSGPEVARALLDEVIEHRDSSVVGITIGGSEQLFPPAQFAQCYGRARENGLRLSVHAGEAAGPESVWEALRLLQPERIGHGVRSIEDPTLVAHLAEKQIPLEVCPTSNIRTGIYPSIEAHPVRALLETGVPVTINTDDPTFFGVTLAEEYAQLHAIGGSAGDLRELIKNGFRHAFLPESEINGYLAEVDRTWNRAMG